MKKLAVLLFSLCGVFLLTACQQDHGEIELSGSIQGTTYHIKWADHLDLDRDRLHKGIEDRFQDIDIKLSNYREDSEISRLNRRKTTEWLAVSQEIAGLIAIAKQVHVRSSGCYDLTVKPLFDLWGFSRHEMRVPEQADIDRVLGHVGMGKVEIDPENLRLRKLDPEIAIDLSSIAQGYTVGAIGSFLESHGIHNYLAEIGGEMKVKGRKASGSPWKIAIEKPKASGRDIQKILGLHPVDGIAIMTSGTYRNFFEQQGQVYSHIIDPRTGRPVTHRLLSVTVLDKDPTWADAWSTALLCLGDEDGWKVAEAERLRALFIYAENGELRERLSSEMAKTPNGD